jgi:glycosyltransferase involved in cell wall biosynthesis
VSSIAYLFSGVTVEVNLSIVVVNYNHGHYLEFCLNSILQQTELPAQIIVVDDGSTDNSRSILAKYAERPLIKVILNERNLGVEKAINIGLSQVKTSHVFGLAADDYILPQFVERSMSAARHYPQVGVVCSLPTFQEEGVRQLRVDRPQHEYLSRYFSASEIVEELNPGHLWIAGHTSVARTDLVLDCGGHPPQLRWHSDWFVFHCIGLRAGVYFLNESLSVMRMSPDSYSNLGKRHRDDQNQIVEEFGKLLTSQFSDIREPFLQSGLMNYFPYQKRRLRNKLSQLGVNTRELNAYFGFHWSKLRGSAHRLFQAFIEDCLEQERKNRQISLFLNFARGVRRMASRAN